MPLVQWDPQNYALIKSINFSLTQNILGLNFVLLFCCFVLLLLLLLLFEFLVYILATWSACKVRAVSEANKPKNVHNSWTLPRQREGCKVLNLPQSWGKHWKTKKMKAERTKLLAATVLETEMGGWPVVQCCCGCGQLVVGVAGSYVACTPCLCLLHSVCGHAATLNRSL